LAEFFKAEIELAFKDQNLQTSEEVGFYLVNLLQVFSKTEVVAMSLDEPLALLLHRAVFSEEDMRLAAYRHLGDISLYVAGLFSPSLRRRAVDVNYAICMGSGAYATVAGLVRTARSLRSNVLTELYTEMSAKFSALVEVLTQISERTTLGADSPDLADLYQRWARTKGRHLIKRMQALGVFPGSQAGA
jgi:hypothetical protein